MPGPIIDTLDRTDSATTMGYTTTGQRWVPNSGVWGIEGNKAYAVSGSQLTTVVETGMANCEISVTMSGTAFDGGPCWRSVDDANNFILAGGQAYKRVAGTFTAVGPAVTVWAAGDVIKVIVNGSSHTILKNNLPWISFTDTAHQTATKHGLRTFSASAIRFDDFRVEALASATPVITYGTMPSASVVAEFEEDVVNVVAWADIYEADNVTPWRLGVAVQSGSVSVDMSRSERRNLDISLNDSDDALGYGPNGFWYDKIIKPFRGITLANGDLWVAQLGEFMPDNITRPHFPTVMNATCRDFVKKLMLDKFPDTTTFASGLNISTVINTIATNGGITKFNFTGAGATLAVATTFERGTTRWAAMEELAKSMAYEIFFDGRGYLTLRPNVDPLTAPVSYTFRTGATANLEAFSRSTTDTSMFNDVIVRGTGPSNPLVNGRAQNTNASSPTRIAKIGRRIYIHESQFVADNTKANEIATSMLAVMALEQYDMSISSIAAPWLEVGDAIETNLMDATPGDPTRFLLSSFSIPLGLGLMSGTAKRITIVA